MYVLGSFSYSFDDLCLYFIALNALFISPTILFTLFNFQKFSLHLFFTDYIFLMLDFIYTALFESIVSIQILNIHLTCIIAGYYSVIYPIYLWKIAFIYY